ncbi:MAG TPA: 3' terminal RNA ribose 2'-O-methyltransferase Hen1 [Polyangiaceae bacterium]|nr:3' terminal RNA ribose 2'-O-methyltransferase Hen1 [Polyangiaceae bacterium]
MLLTITTTHRPATDLGFLLHKNPARLQSYELSFGHVHVFYPEATDDRCTAALLLEVDPIALSRGHGERFGEGQPLEPYVNDRPYAASSFLSVALTRVLRSAMAGTSKERPELVDTVLPLEATLACLPCTGGEDLLRRLFEPLGYEVIAVRADLDTSFPEWGPSPYFRVTLRATCKLRDLLVHLYVLVPVLDDEKHYFVGDDEVAKLLRHGEGWLSIHPACELIAKRYLKHQRSLADAALQQLLREEDVDGDELAERNAREEDSLERPMRLDEQRISVVLAALKAAGAKSVIDLGCGEGKLLRVLLKESTFERIVGLDVAHRPLERAAERLRLESLPERQRARVTLLHGSVLYRDKRLAGFDAAALVEVVEHIDPSRLHAFERVVFEFARPRTVVLTTPNAEYNVHFDGLADGKLRHKDHRFEWNRAELEEWARDVAGRFGYTVRLLGIGPDDPTTGPPTQMAIFALSETEGRH